MRLCDAFLKFRHGDETSNRCPAGPLRSTTTPDQFRCFRCGGWTPHGGLPSIERVAIVARETASITARLAEDYAWAHSVSFAPTRRGPGSNGRGLPHGDPTGNSVADTRRAAVRDRALLAARLLERALRDLRAADEAIGDALLAAEPPGPVDHTKAPFHDPASLFPGRPDLAEAHAARARRRARGEGVPT